MNNNNNIIDFADSIDDIIGLLNKESSVYKGPDQPLIISNKPQKSESGQ